MARMTQLKPHQRQSIERERHATWLELFFDLVFVFAIAQVAHLLHGNPTWIGIAEFAALFVPVWWLWIDFSYYADLFNVDQGPYRLVMLSVMFGLVAMALTLHDTLHGGALEFAAIYATLRLVIIVLYAQAWRLVRSSRQLTGRYTLSFSIALAFWLLSMAVPEPLRFWLWGLALLIEIGNGPLTYLTIREVPQQQSHMDERFGLFVIIVLGEAMIAVATGVAETNWQWQSALAGAGGFLTAVALWWLYFERADETTINWALRGGKRALLRSYVYGYSHLLAFMGIVGTGVGVQFAIETAGEGFMTPMRAILCGGIATFLTGVTLLQWATPRSLPSGVILARLLLALVALVLIPLGAAIPPVAIVLVSGLSLVLLNMLDGLPLHSV